LDLLIVGSYLAVLSLIFMGAFMYLYQKDKDKRKLFFTVIFVAGFLGTMPLIVPRWNELQLFPNWEMWAGLTPVSGILIAVASSISGKEGFKKLVKVHQTITVSSTVIMLLPFQVDLNIFTVYVIISVVTFFLALFLVLKRRDISDLMFLFTTIFYTAAEISLNTTSLNVEFLIVTFTCAHIFMGLIFITSKTSNKQGIASFFSSYQNELEKTKRKLEISQKRLVHVENIFDASPDAIVVSDLEGKIVECNNATVALLGFEKKDDLIEKDYANYITASDLPKLNDTLQSISETDLARSFELVALDKDGRGFPVEVSTSVIRDSKGNSSGLVSIVKDITQRKRMEEQLKNYSDHLEKLVDERTEALKESQEQLLKSRQLAAIGQAATMVGHDLRNPLQAIENGIFYIETGLPNHQLSEKAKETFERIHRSIEYADNIVNNLQSFTAKKKPMLLETPLDTIIEDFLLIFKKPDKIEVIVESEKLPKVLVDKEMIERVFVNLANNGLQAMEKKGGKLKISVKTTNDFVKVTFTDTGVGIAEDNLEKIFTPFFTTKAQGMGLGLPICKRIIEKHGGSITVESKVGEGSTFTVNLPIQSKGGEKLG
jgi:PAS domain S-box-containing protein